MLTRLRAIGSENPKIREGTQEKEGPIKTDQGFFIIDAPFNSLLTGDDVAAGKGKGDGKDGIWEVQELAETINNIQGVLEVGLFYGLTGPQAQAKKVIGGQRPVAAYFGMEDGSVQMRQV